jgi:maspardin
LLHGATGTAEVFYKQMLSLAPKGYRLVSVQYPGYNTYARFLPAFDKFLDFLNINEVHLFGTALGGYLAQCYAQYRPQRVMSLILCCSITDTKYYADANPFSEIFQWTPDFLLKRMLLSNFPDYELEREIANSIDFMVEQLESVKREDLASRLLLNCTVGPFVRDEFKLDENKITIIDVFDDVVLPEKVREQVFKTYPNARHALLKSGGNFPYLSRADEINLHIEVHLRSVCHIAAPEAETHDDNQAVIQAPPSEDENQSEKKISNESKERSSLPVEKDVITTSSLEKEFASIVKNEPEKSGEKDIF